MSLLFCDIVLIDLSMSVTSLDSIYTGNVGDYDAYNTFCNSFKSRYWRGDVVKWWAS